MLNKIINVLKYIWIRRSGQSLIEFYRKKGCKIGDRYYVKDPKDLIIDYSRPSLIEIGDHVFFHKGLKIMTHDYTSWVFQDVYDEFLPSSGKVRIGNNVWFGEDCTVLKGVTIGDNCIIGIGSIVTKDIPPNSVAAGSPAKVIYTLEEYFKRRKKEYVQEAVDYAYSIVERYGRNPNIYDFTDDYPCFVDGANFNEYKEIIKGPKSFIFGKSFHKWKKNHKAKFNGFNEFLLEVNKKKNE